MSSSKKDPSAAKSSRGIFGLVKKKTSKKRRQSQDSIGKSSASSASEVTETESLSEAVDFTESATTGTTAMEVAELEVKLIELDAQLHVSQGELDVAGNKIKQHEETIANLQNELHKSKEELHKSKEELHKSKEELHKSKEELHKSKEELDQSKGKLAKVEAITNNLDDDSFHQAQEFQLKKQIEDLQNELCKRRNLEQQVNRLKEEIQDLQTQNQELRFQEERSSTRSKMKSLSEEKTSKDEVQRLQKELRAAERNLKYETSNLEAQLKAAQDGNERLQEKVKLAKRIHNDLDKERLDLKIENGRLLKKMESSGSFAEKKRIQTEQETAELALKNLKRKTVRLEQQLTASNQMLNMIGAGVDMGENSGRRMSGVTSPDPAPRQTLSEARICHLEKEVQQLEMSVTKLKKENGSLTDKASSCEQTSEVFSLKVNQLDHQLENERNKVEELESELNRLRKLAADGSGEDYLAKILKQMEDLETSSKEQETKFHVKEKDLWSTIEAQKKQLQELEMEKLALELGEDEGELSDGEERSTTPRPEDGDSQELISLKEEVENLKKGNQRLKEDLDGAVSKLLSSAEDTKPLQEEIERLKSENDHLKDKSNAQQKNEVEQLRGELKKNEADQVSLNDQIHLCQQEIATLKSHNEQCTMELKEAKTKVEQLTSLQNQIKKEKEGLQQKIATKEADTSSADVISSLEKEVESLNTQISHLLRDLEDAERELDSRSDGIAEIEKLQKETEKLREENKRLKSDLNDAEDEVEKLDAELIEQTKLLQEKLKCLKEEKALLLSEKDKKGTQSPVRRSGSRESTPPSPGTNVVSVKTKKVIATGGIKLPVSTVSVKKKSAASTEATNQEEDQNKGAPQQAPSLTPKFKKPPPAPKKKPSREAMRNKAEETTAQS